MNSFLGVDSARAKEMRRKEASFFGIILKPEKKMTLLKSFAGAFSALCHIFLLSFKGATWYIGRMLPKYLPISYFIHYLAISFDTQNPQAFF